MKRQSKLNGIIKNIGKCLVFVAVIFLIHRVISIDIDIKSYISCKVVVKLIGIMFLYIALMVVQFIPWKIIVYSVSGVNVEGLDICRVTLKSSVMKYIPGNVFQYVGRMELLEFDEKLNVSNVVCTIVLDSIAVVLAALLLGFAGARAVMFNLLVNVAFAKQLLVICCIMFLVTCFILRNRIAMFLKKKNIIMNSKVAFALLVVIIIYVIDFVAQGFILILIINTVSDGNYISNSMGVCSAYALGWIAGYVTPGASGGIGIREMVLCSLLQGKLSEAIVIIATLIYRLISIMSDLLAFGIIEVIYLRKNKQINGMVKEENT